MEMRMNELVNKIKKKRKIIPFALVAIRMFNFNILLYLPMGKILYCNPVNMVCFPNLQLVITIWKLGKNKFLIFSACQALDWRAQ
jgi:hypothetical protein